MAPRVSVPIGFPRSSPIFAPANWPSATIFADPTTALWRLAPPRPSPSAMPSTLSVSARLMPWWPEDLNVLLPRLVSAALAICAPSPPATMILRRPRVPSTRTATVLCWAKVRVPSSSRNWNMPRRAVQKSMPRLRARASRPMPTTSPPRIPRAAAPSV